MQMHLVHRIEKRSSGRYQILLEGEDSFPLYWKEIRHYEIEEGCEIEEKAYQEIVEELLPARAKKKALHLLEQRAYTEHQLRRKLADGGYPSEIVEAALAYVKSFRYIDDIQYARTYIEGQKERKSLRKMEQDLYRKGITKEKFQAAVTELDPLDEERQILGWIEKKRFCAAQADKKETERFIRFLLYRGYEMNMIRKILRKCEEEAGYEGAVCGMFENVTDEN